MIDVLTYSDLFCDDGDKESIQHLGVFRSVYNIVDQLSYENSELGIKSW